MITPLRLAFVVASFVALEGCAADSPSVPSLAPRAGEAIDPRIPVADRASQAPADPALGTALDRLVQTGRGGDEAFNQAMAAAEALAAGAGSPRSETWIAAQEKLSVATAARFPVTRSLAEIDALAAARVIERGGITPADQRQFDEASAALAALDARQAARIRAVQSRLSD